MTALLDDTAVELFAAAKKLDPEASATAVVCGSGPGVDAVCSEMTSVYQEVWKIDDDSLSYPNAEVIRELLCNILPEDAIILIAHEHFGMDLSSGLSVKLDSAYLPDAIEFVGIENGNLKAVRQELQRTGEQPCGL